MNKKNLIYILMYFLTIGIIVSVFIVIPANKGEFKYINLLITIFAMSLVTKYIKGFLFMLIAPWYSVWKKIDDKKWPDQNPKVSILVPAYNEEVGLLSTVKTILQSKYRNVEVLIVNDGSTDNSDKMMKEFLASHSNFNGMDVRYFYKENGGKGKALNFALEKSTGSIIISIDADCVLTPDTIGNFVKRFNNPAVDAVVGNVKIGNSSNTISLLQQLEFQFSFYWKKAESVLGIIYIIGGAAGAYRKEVFEKFGGYDTKTITEDIDLSVKIQSSGLKSVYAEDAVVYTEGAVTGKGLVKQRIRWKYGWFTTFANHKELIFSRNKQHNKFLCWFIIPFSYFNNLQLMLEPWCILLLYTYCLLTNDFSPFLSWIVLESLPFFIHAFFDDKEKRKFSFLVYSPISWLIFHLSTYVEYRALLGSLNDIIRKREATWGVWTRTGVGIAVNDLKNSQTSVHSTT